MEGIGMSNQSGRCEGMAAGQTLAIAKDVVVDGFAKAGADATAHSSAEQASEECACRSAGGSGNSATQSTSDAASEAGAKANSAADLLACAEIGNSVRLTVRAVNAHGLTFTSGCGGRFDD